MAVCKVGYATCKDVLYAGNVIVVIVGSVMGGRIRLQGGIQLTTGAFSL